MELEPASIIVSKMKINRFISKDKKYSQSLKKALRFANNEANDTFAQHLVPDVAIGMKREYGANP
jgi:hypothetical protein